MKTLFAKSAYLAESTWDRLRGQNVIDGVITIDPYFGYAYEDKIRLRGRALVLREAGEVDDLSRWHDNLEVMIRLFNTKEVSGLALYIQGQSDPAITDEEGYFDVSMPKPKDLGDTIRASAPSVQASICLPICTYLSHVIHGVISDIDDTMMKTEAWSLLKNVWNSLTGNAMTRLVFPDAVNLMQSLTQSGEPVFYVSSSPWNFHGFLRDVFERAGLPVGPIFLRDYGIAPDKFITGTHGHHKLNAISRILREHAHLTFTLIGDLGQHDPMIYASIVNEHADRIERVILRQAPNSADPEKQLAISEIQNAAIPVFVVDNYNEVPRIKKPANPAGFQNL